MEVEIEVSKDDIDELGHVNNARFLNFFERGRMDWYNSVGLFSAPSTAGRLGTVVVSITVNFRRECFDGDRLKVLTVPRSRGNRSFVLHQEIRKPSGELVADADVTSVVMDLDARSVLEPPDCLSDQFRKPEPVEKSSTSKEKS